MLTADILRKYLKKHSFTALAFECHFSCQAQMPTTLKNLFYYVSRLYMTSRRGIKKYVFF